MSISVKCGQCHKEYRVDDRLAGKKARCKQCGAIMAVPEPLAELPDPIESNDDPFAAMEQLESAKVMEKKFSANISPASIGSTNAPRPAPSPPTGTGGLLPAPRMVGPSLAPQQSLGYAPRTKYSSRAPVEGATPMLVLLYLLAHLSYTIIAIVQIYSHDFGGAPEAGVKEVQRKLVGIAITGEVAQVLLFFGLLTPLVMLAMWISGKIMKFGMPDGFFLKCAGVAAVPGVMLGLALLLSVNPVLVILCLVAALPVAFYVMMYAFGLDWGESGVSFAFSSIFYAGGQFFSTVVLAGIMLAAIFGADADPSGLLARYRQGAPGTLSNGGGTVGPSTPSDGGSYTPPAPTDLVADRISRLRERIVEAGQDRALERATREEYLAQLTELRRQANELRAQRNDSSTQELLTLLDEAGRKAEGLPSRSAPPELYEPLVPAETWAPADLSNPILGDEVTVRSYKLRPLKETLLELRSSENSEEGLAWSISRREGRGRMQVTQVRKSNPKQRRPWVTVRSFQTQAAEKDRLLAIDASQAGVTTGSLGSLAFTRVAYKPGEHAFERWVKYIAEDGDSWLIVTLIAGKDDAQMIETLETAVKTIRKQRGGEDRVDPFAPPRVAARLADDPEGASAILRRIGKPAEDAILPYLKSDSEAVRERAVALLGDCGTEKSLPALRELAKGVGRDRRIVKAARASWRKIAPKELDNVDEAIMDVQSEDWQVQREAMETLAREKADARRDKVAPLLEQALLGDKGFFTHEEASKALMVWFNSKTASHMIPFLNDEHNRNDRKLKEIIDVAAATQDPQAVHPVLQWLPLQPDAVKAALIRMGPVAEDEVLKYTDPAMFPPNSPDAPRIRVIAAEILEQIGGPKTVRRIAVYAKDKRDPTVHAAMNAAYEAAKARSEAPKK